VRAKPRRGVAGGVLPGTRRPAASSSASRPRRQTRWSVASGIRCKSAGVVPLHDQVRRRSDSYAAVGGLAGSHRAWPSGSSRGRRRSLDRDHDGAGASRSSSALPATAPSPSRPTAHHHRRPRPRRHLGEDRSRPRLRQRVHPSPATTPLALQVFDLLCCSLEVNEYIYDKRARLTWPSRDPDDEE
jgi:hypothetical protein